MTMASAGYVANDAFIRTATDDGVGAYQALFIRGIFVPRSSVLC